MKALFLIGGPGSGKDAVLRGTALNNSSITEISLAQLHEAITQQKSLRCVDTDQPVIVNGNADDLNKVLICKQVLECMEYKTACLYVYTTDEESKRRNDQRARLGARTFTEEVRSRKYQSSFKNIKPLEEAFTNFTLFDNSFNPGLLSEEQKQEVAGWIHELNQVIKGFFAGKQSIDEQVTGFLNEEKTVFGGHSFKVGDRVSTNHGYGTVKEVGVGDTPEKAGGRKIFVVHHDSGHRGVFDHKELTKLTESWTGATRMQIQAHYDARPHLMHAQRVAETEKAHGIHDLKVNNAGVVVHYKHNDTLPSLLRRQAEEVVIEDKNSETGAHRMLHQTAQHKALGDATKKQNTGMSGYTSHNTQSTAKQVAQKKFDKAANDQRTNNSGQTVRNSPQPVVTGPSHLSGKSKVNESRFKQFVEDVSTTIDKSDGNKLPSKKKPAKAARAPVQLGDIRQGDGMSATATFAAENKKLEAMETALAGHSNVEHHTDCPLCMSHMEHGVHKTHAAAKKEHRHHIDLAYLHGDLAEGLGGGTIPNSTFTQVAAAAAGHPESMKKPKTLKKLKEELATKSPDAEFAPAPEVYEDWGVDSEDAMFEGRAIKTNKPFKIGSGYGVYVTDGNVVNRLAFNKKASVLTEEVALTDAKFWETLR